MKISRPKTNKGSSSKEKRARGDNAAADERPTSSSSTSSTSSLTSSTFDRFEAEILSLLRSRRPGTNCCPSEVPRGLLAREKKKQKQEGGGGGGGGAGGDWRSQMPAVREAAARLVERGQLEITQGGVAVADPRGFKGPIRLRLVE